MVSGAGFDKRAPDSYLTSISELVTAVDFDYSWGAFLGASLAFCFG